MTSAVTFTPSLFVREMQNRFRERIVCASNPRAGSRSAAVILELNGATFECAFDQLESTTTVRPVWLQKDLIARMRQVGELEPFQRELVATPGWLGRPGVMEAGVERTATPTQVGSVIESLLAQAPDPRSFPIEDLLRLDAACRASAVAAERFARSGPDAPGSAKARRVIAASAAVLFLLVLAWTLLRH